MARGRIRDGRRGRFFNVVDLADRLSAEAKADRQGRTADARSRLDCWTSLCLTSLAALPFAMSGGRILYHLAGKPANARRSWRRRTSRSGSGRACSSTRR